MMASSSIVGHTDVATAENTGKVEDYVIHCAPHIEKMESKTGEWERGPFWGQLLFDSGKRGKGREKSYQGTEREGEMTPRWRKAPPVYYKKNRSEAVVTYYVFCVFNCLRNLASIWLENETEKYQKVQVVSFFIPNFGRT